MCLSYIFFFNPQSDLFIYPILSMKLEYLIGSLGYSMQAEGVKRGEIRSYGVWQGCLGS